MRDSRRTSLLLTAAIALLLVHFFPQLAGPIAWLALAVALVWASVVGSRLLTFARDKRLRAVQQAADDRDFLIYKAELDALRTQYDPDHAWNESTEYPSDYRESLSALHERHRAMLERRFGPS